jgi:PAS domain S-box-containing protein
MYSKDYFQSTAYSPEEIGMRMFRKISQDMPYMVFITRASNFKLLYANRKVTEFLGFDLQDLHKMEGGLLDMMEADDIQSMMELGPRLAQIKGNDAVKIKVKLRAKEGKVVYLETTISVFKLLEDGTPSEYFCVSEDITEKVMLEARAMELEVVARAAEESFAFGAWEWDMLKNEVKWSDGFWEMLEYPPSLRNNQWMPISHYLKHLSPEHRELVNGMVQNPQAFKGNVQSEPLEITLNTYTGKTQHVITRTSVTKWHKDKPVYAIGSTANVTQIKNAQKALEAKNTELAKSYKEMEEFAYVASHDLQEPLRKITTFSERLKEKSGDSLHPDCVLYLDRIIDGAARMRILIENLLALSRTKRNADYFKPTNLNEILSEVAADLEISMAHHKSSVILPASPLPTIEAIPTQMHQLFLNILTNSLKFAKENQPSIIKINHEFLSESQKNEYSLDTTQDYVHIQIEDNGIGFENSYAETIFTPFKRLHGRSEYEGTGIGLAICKKVTQNHGGIIWAKSSPGNGATFHIVLATRQPIEDTNNP